jgi:hypothetical protein
MNDAEFRQARQRHPREGTARHYDAIGDAGELVVSGSEDRIRNERRQLSHASADLAQAGVSGCDKGGARPAADELFADGEGADGFSGLFKSAGADHKNRTDMKNLPSYFVIQRRGAESPRSGLERKLQVKPGKPS